MKKNYLCFLTLLFLSSCSGCSKLGYIIDQGVGQMKIQFSGKSIEKVIDDKKTDPVIKDKLVVIQSAKAFFFDFFEVDPTHVYRQVVFLDTDAVTYLVIVSPFDKVEPLLNKFPIVGEFPYLGFFSKKKAFRYAQKLQKKGHYTYIRPVYAYSSLGYFEDKILSSFFHYDDDDLIELIFHELIHSIFFAENEVVFNENFADFVATELVNIYFPPEQLKDIEKKRTQRQVIQNFLTDQALTFRDLVDKGQFQSKAQSDAFLKSYLNKSFAPQALRICESLEMQSCDFAKRPWNHAGFAAFLTYSEKSQFMQKIFDDHNQDLKAMLEFIQKRYRDYKNAKSKLTFMQFLKG